MRPSPVLYVVFSLAILTAPSTAQPSPDDTPRPTLTEDASNEVRRLDVEIARKAEDGDFEGALEHARRIVEIMTPVFPTDWWQFVDARQQVTDFERFCELPAETRAQVAKSYALVSASNQAFRQGNATEAERLLRELLDLRVELLGPEHPAIASVQSNLATVLMDRGDAEGAERLYRAAHRMRSQLLGDSHPGVVNIETFLATLLERRGKYEEAESLYRHALEVFPTLFGPDHPRVTWTQQSLGELLFTVGEFDEAMTLARRALETIRRVNGSDHPDVVQGAASLGMLLVRSGQHEEAEALLDEALTTGRRLLPPAHPFLAKLLLDRSSVHRRLGQNAEAELTVREALGILRPNTPPEHPARRVAQGVLARVLIEKGELEEAERLLIETLVDEETGSTTNDIECLHDLASIHDLRGEPEEAIEILRRAVARSEEIYGDNLSGAAQSMVRLASALSEAGRLTESEALFRRLLDSGEDETALLAPIRAKYEMRFAVVLSEAGQHEEALVRSRRAVEYWREQPDDVVSMAWGLAERATVLRNAGDLAAATPLYSQALALVEATRVNVIGDERGRAAYAGRLALDSIARDLAEAHALQGDFLSAFDAAERGRARALLDLLARSERNLIEHAQRTSSPARSRELEAALERRENAESRLRGEEFRLARLRARSDLGRDEREQRILEQMERLEVARREVSSASIATLDKLRASFPIAKPKDSAAVRSALGQTEVILSYSATDDRIIATVVPADGSGDVRGAIITPTSESTQAVFDRARRVRSAVESPTEGPTLDADLRELGAILLPAEIRAALSPASRWIVVTNGPLVDFPFELLPWPTDASRTETLVDRTTEIVMASSASVYLDRKQRTNRRAEGPITVVAVGGAIFDREPPAPPESGVVIEAVEPQSMAESAGLRPGDVIVRVDDEATPDHASFTERVGVVNARFDGESPRATFTVWRHGETRDVSLALADLGLRLSRDSIEQGLAMIATTRSSANDVAESSALDFVRLFGGHLEPLPGTLAEVGSIAQLFLQSGHQAIALTGAKATLPRIESNVDGATYVHFSTHGLVGSTERPYDASLALTTPFEPTPNDIGFLTLERLVSHWRGKLNDCDLAVLSACDTRRGVTKGGTVLALPWGFYFAGAKAVIASLWPVDDASTRLLMERLYENLLGAYDTPRSIGGREFPAGTALSKARALQEAKRWLRDLEAPDVRRRLGIESDEEWSQWLARHRGVPRLEESTAPSREVALRPFAHPHYWAAFVLNGAAE